MKILKYIFFVVFIPFYLIYFLFKGVYNYLKSKKTSKRAVNYDGSLTKDYFYDHDKYVEKEKTYGKYVTQHFKYNESIEIIYSVAINLNGLYSNDMEKCISLCLKDIELASKLVGYWSHDGSNTFPLYSSFSRLAIIYEKRKEYDKAIEICNKAINLGYMKDRNPSGMVGRLARLMKKQLLET